MMLLKLAFEFDTPPPKSYRNKKKHGSLNCRRTRYGKNVTWTVVTMKSSIQKDETRIVVTNMIQTCTGIRNLAVKMHDSDMYQY